MKSGSSIFCSQRGTVAKKLQVRALDFAWLGKFRDRGSGSPVLDARGRLVGIAFDGNIHSIAGAYWFNPEFLSALAFCLAGPSRGTLRTTSSRSHSATAPRAVSSASRSTPEEETGGTCRGQRTSGRRRHIAHRLDGAWEGTGYRRLSAV